MAHLPSLQLPEREVSHDRRDDHIDSRHVWHLCYLPFLGHISRL